jgi:hypothetical protein
MPTQIITTANIVLKFFEYMYLEANMKFKGCQLFERNEISRGILEAY